MRSYILTNAFLMNNEHTFQVAKLGPVSRAAGLDCECPLYDV